jgi:hypothetical protein
MSAGAHRWNDRQVAALEGAWTGLAPVERPAGLEAVGLAAHARGLPNGASVTAVLQGTALHPDAPAGAWSPLATLTCTEEAPASGLVGQGCVVVLGCRWLRWSLSHVGAAGLADVTLVIDGDIAA